jgi:ABC-type sugar transport system ATPase subunit
MNLLPARVEETSAGLCIVHGSLNVPVAGLCEIGAYRGEPIVLGIRPEDLYERPLAEGIAIDLRVVAVEALGPETVLVAAIPGGAEISARLGRAFTAPIGSTQRLYLDPGQIHLFDPQTRLAVPRHPSTPQVRRAGP